MPVYAGSSAISKIYHGSNLIASGRQGITQFFGGAAPPANLIDPYWDSVVLLLQDSLEDESSRNQAVTVSGDAAISTAQVKVGTHSLAFDNSGDRLTLPAGSDFAFGTGDYTVETWIYILPHSTTNQVRVLSTSNSSSNFSFEVMSAGTLRMWTGSNLLNFGGNVTRESWHHVAFCRSGGTVRAFVDGLIVGGPVSNSTNMTNTQSVQTPLY